MIVEPHDLDHEFPEFRDSIAALKQSDAHFAKLFEEYNEMDRVVHRAEEGDEHLGDFELEDIKKRRVHLKDELYALLRARSDH